MNPKEFYNLILIIWMYVRTSDDKGRKVILERTVTLCDDDTQLGGIEGLVDHQLRLFRERNNHIVHSSIYAAWKIENEHYVV